MTSSTLLQVLGSFALVVCATFSVVRLVQFISRYTLEARFILHRNPKSVKQPHPLMTKQGGVVARLQETCLRGFESFKKILTTTLKVSCVLFPSTSLDIPHPAVVQMSSFPSKGTSHDTEQLGAWPTTRKEAEATLETRKEMANSFLNDILCGYQAGDRHRNRNRQLQALY